MKKNFFKKLSFVMALAMIASLVAPAAGVFAASGAHLNATKKYLHLAATSPYNAYDFNIAHKGAGWQYAWSSSNEDVAEVDPANGYTTATGVGTAKITVAITDKDGADVDSLEATVVVRDNIKTIDEIYMQTANAPALDKLQVATAYDFGRKFTTDAGSKTETSAITRWFVDSTKATIDDAGIFKATDAGTYKITAVAFQSKEKYTAWKALNDTTATTNVLATKTLEVKVVNDVTVAQTDKDSVKLTFAAPVASLTVADVAVAYIVTATNTPIAQVVKAVTLAADKKSATVDMYNAFSGTAKYSVTVNGMAAKEFTAATNAIADVDYFTITPATSTVVNPAVATNIVVTMFNKDGVDITTADMLSRVVLTNSSEKVLFAGGQGNNSSVTFFTVGDATTISGVFHTYSYDTTTGAEVGNKTASAVITGIAPTAGATVGNVAAWTIAAAAPTDNFAAVSHVIAAGDGSLALRLYVRTLMSDGNYDASTNADANYRFESTDNTTLIISDNILYPVKAGVVNVLVRYSTDAFATSTVLAAIPITVTAERVATTLNLGASTFALSNDASVNDSKNVTIEVKDQYGRVMTNADVSVTLNTVTWSASDLTGAVAGGAGSVTFSASGATPGVYTYKVSANGLSKYVVVNVQAPNGAPALDYYRLKVDNTSYDNKVEAATDTVATVKVYKYAANGVATDVEAVSGGAVVVTLTKPDGTNGTSLFNYDIAANGSTIQIALAAPGGTATQLATGIYTLKLFVGGALKDTVTFEVKSTQGQLAASVTTLEATGATNIDEAVVVCFAAKLGDTDVTADLEAGDVVGAGNVVFVKTITYTDAATGVTYTATVNTAITLPFVY